MYRGFFFIYSVGILALLMCIKIYLTAVAAAAAPCLFLDPLVPLDAELSLESMDALSEKAESLSGLSMFLPLAALMAAGPPGTALFGLPEDDEDEAAAGPAPPTQLNVGIAVR